MSDITLCANNDCPIKWSCLRMWEKPTKWQSYARFVPYYKNGMPTCDAHLNMSKADIKRLIKHDKIKE